MMRELADIRREEIINACEKLYKTNNFKDITIKLIGEKTSFSRTSIYNYFETKEEIFLALLQREYEKWILDLNNMYNQNDKMTKEAFADKLAHTIETRTNLLKLLSMNMYDMEENSRMERLVEFKTSYGNAIKELEKLLSKFFPEMTEQEINDFLFSFLPLMYGIYPYTFVTEKQKEAMKNANVPFKYYSIYEMANMGIKKILGI